ncbi:MAG: glycosyltransferase family 2 protein [Lachnospiraceae bacterium]|nr:glycosyltransferase family 2 protein [Lachnospiraceae bacterium]
MKTVVLIPAYNPGKQLKNLVDELMKKDFQCLVVDDGSSEETQHYFDDLNCKIFRNPMNLGKGAALKNGMRCIREEFPEAEFFITADSDGQHMVSDICRIREELERGKDFVISVRSLKHAKTPLKSRIGNALSRFFFCLANNHYLPDNQSGLRGFSVKHIDWMLNVSGDKYDYELNLLLIAEKQGIKVGKIDIEAIYFDNNSNTHFKPLLDTARIYRRYFQTEMFALIGIAINLIMVIISQSLWGSAHMFATIFYCWGVYALLYFVVERYTIFRNIKYTPGVRRLFFSIFRYAIYTLICFAIQFIFHWSFLAAFIIAMVMTAFLEFYLLKVAYE